MSERHGAPTQAARGLQGRADEPLAIRRLFTGEGIAWLTTALGENYIGFPPLVTVATILLAIGIAEKSGFLSAAIRYSIGSAPRWLLPYAVGFVGVVGSIMADSAFVVIPTVPALAESAAEVTPISNYWFTIVSALVLALVAGFVIDKVVEPRVVRAGVSREEIDTDEDLPGMTDTRAQRILGDEQTVAETQEPRTQARLTRTERRGLAWGTTAFLLVGAGLRPVLHRGICLRARGGNGARVPGRSGAGGPGAEGYGLFPGAGVHFGAVHRPVQLVRDRLLDRRDRGRCAAERRSDGSPSSSAS